jgi:DNA repair protein RadD
MFIPRDYQTEAVSSIWKYFQTKSGNPLVAMPTGTGKSVVIADFLRTIYGAFPSQRVMILTHVKELIQQNYAKLLQLWPMAPAGIYSSGLGRRDTVHRIIFAGIASVAKRASEFGKIDLVLVDECHLISPTEETMYNVFFAALRSVNPHIKVVGFTATAWRLGVGKIEGAGLFTDTCFDITHLAAFNRLIDEGYLLPLVPRQPKSLLDIEGVHMRGGEYIAGELQAAVDRDEVTREVLTEAIEIGHDRHSWLLFCSGVEHSIHTAEMLTSMGVPCAAVHSKMPDSERDQILADYRAGRKWRAIANNNVLTTGFDHPMLDLIVVLRPTASPVLWVQMLGRGTRPLYANGFDLTTIEGRLQAIEHSQKKNCLVLDFANNTKRLGPINDPVIPRKKGEKGGEAPVKLCEACNTWNHASARVCFHCGSEFRFAIKIQQEASTEELIKRADNDMPVVEVFKVDTITYESYQKVGKPAMMRVTYYCGMRRFNEYVCFEHEGFPKHKARQWWKERTSLQFPASTAQGISTADMLKVARHLRIWVNKQYPEIMAHSYDGTAFGKEDATDSAEPGIHVLNDTVPLTQRSAPARATTINDDDIPF